jgi:hypothetical protein
MMINDVFQKSVPAAGAAVADTAARYGAIELKSARYLAHKGGSSRTMGSMISGPDRRSVPGPLRYQALVRNAPILTSEPGTGSRLVQILPIACMDANARATVGQHFPKPAGSGQAASEHIN